MANGLGGFVYKPHTKRYSNSSIFLENRDILNDSVDLDLYSGHYLKHDYGGCGGGGGANCNMLTPPDIDGGDKLEKYLGKDLRRYSDTKLLGSADVEASDPMLVCHPAQQQFNPSQRLATRKRPLIKQHSESAATTVLDMTLPHSPLSPPNIHDIKPPARHMVRHSMHTVDIMGPEDSLPHPMAADLTNGSQPSSASYQQQRQHQQQIDKGRQFFKSLPNLSSSCESLIKK